MKKLTVDVSALATAMRFKNKKTIRKSVNSLTDDLKFDVTPSILTITYPVLDNLILSTVPCEADGNFSFLLSADDLELIQKLDNGSVAITVNNESGNVTLINHIAFNSFYNIVKVNLFA